MWYLPPETVSVVNTGNNRNIIANNVCASTAGMIKYIANKEGDSRNLLEKCCQPAHYFENLPSGAKIGK